MMHKQIPVQLSKLIQDEADYFWSPSVRWCKTEDAVEIEHSVFSGIALELFPELYYITQKGIKLESLIEHYSHLNQEFLVDFIKHLINERILVSSILSPQELLYPHNYLVHNPHHEDTFIDPERYNRFKQKKLERTFSNVMEYDLPLEDVSFPEEIVNRRSFRNFDINRKLPFKTFSKLISVFKQTITDREIRYFYATDGGLYPIDIFIYVKDARIEKVKAGLYYYNPVRNMLQMVSSACVITQEAHYAQNQEIFSTSAFSVFMVYNSKVTMPKYGGMGYLYAAIDCGIMVQLLTQVAELEQVGLCSIGDMNFRKIKKYFKLNSSQVMLHSIEVGLK
ncbi:SagB/ThcOx family dehydrogenase [Paenibacillus sp. JJ1722]|uniref:SagB/ThcOx family dehydrogenase n=1 Tax=Paenibacillus sp. JJ1722 TaxID=3398770 RepID=UPI003AAD6BC9